MWRNKALHEVRRQGGDAVRLDRFTGNVRCRLGRSTVTCKSSLAGVNATLEECPCLAYEVACVALAALRELAHGE